LELELFLVLELFWNLSFVFCDFPAARQITKGKSQGPKKSQCENSSFKAAPALELGLFLVLELFWNLSFVFCDFAAVKASLALGPLPDPLPEYGAREKGAPPPSLELGVGGDVTGRDTD
jgi:hypothetical protein